MIKRISTRARVALSLAAAFALAACNQAGKTTDTPKPPAKPPIATVNGTPISSEAFAIWSQSQNNKKPEELTPEARKQSVESIESLYVSAQEAEKKNLLADPEVAAQLELQRLNVLANALFSSTSRTRSRPSRSSRPSTSGAWPPRPSSSTARVTSSSRTSSWPRT